MTTGWQIYKYDETIDECYVNAGLHNWFWDIDDAKKRLKALEATWSEHGVKYIIVKCHN